MIGKPMPNCGAKRTFKQLIADNGMTDGEQYDEVWLVDTIQGRLRRKGFVCQSVEQTELAAPAKRRGRPAKVSE